jgi:two-component system nitrogen regulation response regulator GlnG
MLEGRLDLSPEQLELGPVLVLADAIVVCLRLVREPRFPLVGETFQMVGHSDAIDSLRRNIEDVAHRPPGPVLILGESGSGKEHVARALTRPGGPFIKQNMATLGANLAASALFGHERGAFTGAVDRHEGLFVEADGGTLFLDEIAATPIDVQPMLLDALESDEIKPVGGSSRKSRRVRVRLVAATNADLNVAVRNKQFLGTLLQRFDYQIRVPPLRARREDIGELLLYFRRKEFAGQKSPLERDPAETPWLSASDFARIAVEPFIGNVRQLRAVAKELVGGSRRRTSARIDERVTQVFQRERVAAEVPALPEPTEPSEASKPAEPRGKDPPPTGPPKPRSPSPRKGIRPRRSPEEVVDALRSAQGSAGRAAAALGVSRTTFFELRKENPAIRALSEITDAELKKCRDACKGDVVKMAQSLLVPLKPLTDRLAKLK